MDVDIFSEDIPEVPAASALGAVRIEMPIYHEPTDQQYKIIILDADESIDVIIHYPTGERECVWSLVKEL